MRIDNAIWFEGLNDCFEIAAKYTSNIAPSHAFSDATQRTAFAVAIKFLSLSDFDLSEDNKFLADAVRALVIGELNEADFADILYAQYLQGVAD